MQSVLDVGCGEGHALRFFRDLGCRVRGIDGVVQDDPDISQWDYTQGPLVGSLVTLDSFDLVWACEFVEHVEERYIPNFLHTFSRAPLVLMTHAEPGQGGHHHVNCQVSAYWIGAMAALGYSLDYGLTAQTREFAGFNQNPYNHFARSGLAFVRN